MCVCVCSSVYPPSNNCNYQYKVATRVAGEPQDAAHQPAGRAHYLDFIYPISKKPIFGEMAETRTKGERVKIIKAESEKKEGGGDGKGKGYQKGKEVRA